MDAPLINAITVAELIVFVSITKPAPFELFEPASNGVGGGGGKEIKADNQHACKFSPSLPFLLLSINGAYVEA